MKREILCPKCQEKVRKLFPTDTPYPDEHVKFVVGTAKRDFICDNCTTPIFISEDCCAFTIWADHGRQPYKEWEHDYLTTEVGHPDFDSLMDFMKTQFKKDV